MQKWLMILLSLCFFPLLAQTELSGDISGTSFDSTGNPYIVEQDIIIPEGKTGIIKEGCVFLFKPFTGLIIKGTLLVEGTSQKPVVFTSTNNKEYNISSQQDAGSFDWNGIVITSLSEMVVLKNPNISFSVYGIKSQNPGVQIENGIFRQNGQFNFTVNDQIQLVQDDVPYSYNTISEFVETTIPDLSKPQTEVQDYRGKIVAFRYISLGIGALGVIAGTLCGSQLPSSYDNWTESSESRQVLNSAQRKYKLLLTGTMISGIASLLGTTGFGVSFAF